MVGNNARQSDLTRIVGFRDECLGLLTARNATPFGVWVLRIGIWSKLVVRGERNRPKSHLRIDSPYFTQKSGLSHVYLRNFTGNPVFLEQIKIKKVKAMD